MKYNGSYISLSNDSYKNFVVIDDYDFELKYLKSNYQRSKGAQGSLFLLCDPTEEDENRVIKICKTPISQGNNKNTKRFDREIRALKKALKANLTGVICMLNHGIIEISHERFQYIVMEKAECDLPEYFSNKKLSLSQKISVCGNLLECLKQLHNIGIYHRDIKSDNILYINGEWKICDLGLIQFRSEDKGIDFKNEKIGPYGWLTPEVINKVYTHKKNTEFDFDCKIDEQSDVFQLGKLFWYIFQGNLPIGNINKDDFLVKKEDIFELIKSMLHYNKAKRKVISEIESALNPIRIKYVG